MQMKCLECKPITIETVQVQVLESYKRVVDLAGRGSKIYILQTESCSFLPLVPKTNDLFVPLDKVICFREQFGKFGSFTFAYNSILF